MNKILFLVLLCATAEWGAITHDADITYNSTFDTTIALTYDIAYDATKKRPICVIMHGWQTTKADIDNTYREAIADYGKKYFVIVPETRGYGTAGGTLDCSYYSYDIYDAIRNAIATYPTKVDTSECYFVGCSFGGGTALKMFTQFPDLFGLVVDNFGMSDFGYDVTNGWWYTNTDYQGALTIRIGDPAVVPDNYLARQAIYAMGNNTQTELLIYHDSADDQVSVVHSRLINALAMPNILYTESNPASGVRFLHSIRCDNSEAIWLPVMDSSTHLPPAISSTGIFQVTDYIKTKSFLIMLGTAKNNVSKLNYNLSANTYSLKNGSTANAYTAEFRLYNKWPGVLYKIKYAADSIYSQCDSGGTLIYYVPVGATDSVFVQVIPTLKKGNLSTEKLKFALLPKALQNGTNPSAYYQGGFPAISEGNNIKSCFINFASTHGYAIGTIRDSNNTNYMILKPNQNTGTGNISVLMKHKLLTYGGSGLGRFIDDGKFNFFGRNTELLGSTSNGGSGLVYSVTVIDTAVDEFVAIRRTTDSLKHYTVGMTSEAAQQAKTNQAGDSILILNNSAKNRGANAITYYLLMYNRILDTIEIATVSRSADNALGSLRVYDQGDSTGELRNVLTTAGDTTIYSQYYDTLINAFNLSVYYNGYIGVLRNTGNITIQAGTKLTVDSLGFGGSAGSLDSIVSATPGSRDTLAFTAAAYKDTLSYVYIKGQYLQAGDTLWCNDGTCVDGGNNSGNIVFLSSATTRRNRGWLGLGLWIRP